ncbi:hypothetical protein [Nocardia farcinica]|uniref:Uncharacterized protein n=1 Tax=Nocardia farcinica TaxID=37329 RepID=A0A0H5NRV6_NOCFR|nr:hypothetical protein [Nocardia farcinica]AXK85822.1 hypothetical protein DXT66_09430 [Nocardia farcinica]PFW98971.1 hypothetical protein CJ469_05707 [Nocardia farcinica]PFX05904.1 hypothetical protein CJ468_05115 [Nocardia farcinica]CRY77789.1 Uncharacterised protein [Nocardia farcinica]SIT33771.1 hypothetical protein SAMN05421776_11821 [Nocardia farcinica]
MTDNNDTVMITDEDGMPFGVLYIPAIQEAAATLVYKHAAVAEDSDALARLTLEWPCELDHDTAGYVAAAALTLLTQDVVAPMLAVIHELAPAVADQMRAKLVELRDAAVNTLGGGQ